MRYTGQTHEITINGMPSPLNDTGKEKIAELFHEKHKDLYTYCNMYEPIAVVNIRITALGPEPEIKLSNTMKSQSVLYPSEKRMLYFTENGNPVKKETEIYSRNHLPSGFEKPGPLVIEEDLSTTLVPPGFRVGVQENGILELKERKGENHQYA